MRIPTFIVVTVTCGLLGFIAGRFASPQSAIRHPVTPSAADCPPAQLAEAAERPPIAPTCDDAEVTRLRERVDQLEVRLALQQVLLQGLSVQSQGEALEWPTVVPDSIDPDNFRSVVQEAVGTDDGALDLVDSHCDEPPCIAVLRLEAPATGAGLEQTLAAAADLLGSSTWTGQLGKEVALSHFAPFDCGARGTEWLLLTAAQVPADATALGHDEIGKRVEHRAAAILDEWPCEPIDLRSITAPR